VTAAWLVLVALGFAGAAVFAAVYAAGTRSWYRSAVGRNLMAEALVLAGLLALTFASAVFRLPPWVWIGGMASLDVVLWVQVWLLLRAQHSGKE